MRRSLVWMGSSVLATVICLWAGCFSSGSSDTGGSGGSAPGAGGNGGAGGGAGGGTCAVVDGVCELSLGEDCNCVDCMNTAYCHPGQCLDTMSCDHTLDSCTCPGCAEDEYCGDPTLGNCLDGGACDPYTEGCHCPNCWTYSECQASVAACSGGKPDGICDRATENCDCVDCQGTPLCVPCQNAGCNDEEPCSCADCVTTQLCNDPSRCIDDGVCAILLEGCICDDCKSLPECAIWFDGGTEGGSDGGGPGDGGGADGGVGDGGGADAGAEGGGGSGP